LLPIVISVNHPHATRPNKGLNVVFYSNLIN